MSSVAIIGAGLAGVAAARELQSAGLSVTVFDRGRRLGGRCNTRDGEFQFDHGAQFFSVADPRFSTCVKELAHQGSVGLWDGDFVEIGSDCITPLKHVDRYVGIPSMKAVVESLAADIVVNSSNHVTHAEPSACGWHLTNSDDCDLGEYEALVLAMPAEQARPLVPSESSLTPMLAKIHSEPCWALMLGFDNPLPIPYNGITFRRDDIVWAARDSSKPGRSEGERWVVHGAGRWSRDRFRSESNVVALDLYSAFLQAMEIDPPPPQFMSAHRWGLAFPGVDSLGCVAWDDELRVGVCGDWSVSPRLEGAYISGVECAQMVLDAIGKGACTEVRELSA
ncbi:MAG: FAD-dependent oxidoreductase [Pseudomonadota bacterium]